MNSPRFRFTVLLSTLFTSCVFAQVNTASLQGTVKDQQNVAVSSAALQVIGAAGKQIITTDASGHYRLENLASGEYTVSISALGFRPVIRKRIRLNAGESRNLDLQLKVMDARCEASSFVVWRKSCYSNASAMTTHAQCNRCHVPVPSEQPVAEWMSATTPAAVTPKP